MKRRSPAGADLERWLVAARRSRSWLAERLGVTTVTLWRWMVGERTPSLEHASSIETITGIRAAGWAPQRLPPRKAA